ncbi:MAG: ATP synthase subunit I [Desulfobacterales bacterium]|nr:ATP synthase subunit I [Desulfobacterales bacterium]
MAIHQRLLKFVTLTNWILLFIVSILGISLTPFDFAKGIMFGGLIVTVNFHLLSRTLKKSLTPPHLSSHRVVLAKYYLRFAVSAFILYLLISKHFVDPLGLFIGLSIVVFSITLATILELKKLILKEAI